MYYFHKKAEMWFKEILPKLLGCPAENIHWWVRFEYQWRNSIHYHAFVWLPIAFRPNLLCLRRIFVESKAHVLA